MVTISILLLKVKKGNFQAIVLKNYLEPGLDPKLKFGSAAPWSWSRSQKKYCIFDSATLINTYAQHMIMVWWRIHCSCWISRLDRHVTHLP
jgi:hypothetical protein